MENVMSNKDNKKMTLGEYQMCQSHFSPRQFCGNLKPPQISEVYPLTLIRCRKGNWLHVGSTPTTSTRSRTATLIVGRMAEPMMEAVSLPPKEAINECSSYLLGVVEQVILRGSDTIVFRGHKLSLPYG